MSNGRSTTMVCRASPVIQFNRRTGVVGERGRDAFARRCLRPADSRRYSLTPPRDDAPAFEDAGVLWLLSQVAGPTRIERLQIPARVHGRRRVATVVFFKR